MRYTYNYMIEMLKRVCEGHAFIAKVTKGDIGSVDIKKAVQYPLVHIVPTSSDIGATSITYNFRVFCLDQLDVDKHDNDLLNQEDEIHSDTLRILEDIIAEIRTGNTIVKKFRGGDKTKIELPVTFLPISDDFKANLSGWEVEFGVTFPRQLSACLFPEDQEELGDYDLNYDVNYD